MLEMVIELESRRPTFPHWMRHRYPSGSSGFATAEECEREREGSALPEWLVEQEPGIRSYGFALAHAWKETSRLTEFLNVVSLDNFVLPDGSTEGESSEAWYLASDALPTCFALYEGYSRLEEGKIISRGLTAVSREMLLYDLAIYISILSVADGRSEKFRILLV